MSKRILDSFNEPGLQIRIIERRLIDGSPVIDVEIDDGYSLITIPSCGGPAARRSAELIKQAAIVARMGG